MPIESGRRELLEKAELPFFGGAVGLVFFSFHIGSYPLLWLTVWCFAGGLLTSYLVFQCYSSLPNLLFHLPDPVRKSSGTTNGHTRTRTTCPVCYQSDCHRHANQPAQEYLQPWDGLVLPSTVDTALTTFLELVLEKFISSWQRDLLHDDAFVDEVRVSIRHAASVILRRSQKIDIPSLITGKIMRAAAGHFSTCLRAKEKLPSGVNVSQLEAAVLKELGNHTHLALRGHTSEIRYFHHLLSSSLSILLPSQQTNSKIMRELLQELFAAKVFVPALHFVSRPEFVNKILTIVFNKGSRIHKTIGPAPQDVPFLAAFAQRRSPTTGPLRSSLTSLLNSPTELYGFIQYMKSVEAIGVLQLFLSLKELKGVLEKSSVDETQITNSLTSLTSLHHTHFSSSSSPSFIPLVPNPAPSLTAALSSDLTPTQQWTQLRDSKLIQKLYHQMYQILEETYFPQYCQSQQYYSRYLVEQTNGFKGRTERGNTPRLERAAAAEKRRSWGLSSVSPSLEDLTTTDARSERSDSECGSYESGDVVPVPVKVQIVDQETQTHAVKPHTLYVILSWWEEGDDARGKTVKVKRRFKEFDELDLRLRKFYADLKLPSLPSKRTLRNMDKSFVAGRSRDLQNYLQTLLQLPPIRTSHLLSSFLSNISDPTLFMPDSVGERAGKMIKSAVTVPGRNKEKSLLLTDLLQRLVQSTEQVARQPSEELVERVAMATREWEESSESYQCRVREELSRSQTTCSAETNGEERGGGGEQETLELDGVMDLVVFMAGRLFKVTQLQMTVLLLVKMLGQRTIETYIHHFVGRKVELISQEKVLTELIGLIRVNLFPGSGGVPLRDGENEEVNRGGESDLSWRALGQLLSYPPELLISAIGEDCYRGGVVTLFECLQCHTLNKQLFYTLLDIVLCELFPELNQT